MANSLMMLRAVASVRTCLTRARIEPSGLCLASAQTRELRLFHTAKVARTSQHGREEGQETLKENIYTWPNAISVARAAASPYLAYLITNGNNELALKLLFVAGISDLVDGCIARRWPSQRSVFGTALDPFCDKILMTTVVVAEGAAGLLPVPLAALIIGRDVGLTIGGFVYRYRSLEPPVTLGKFFDATHATTEFRPTTISKWNTALQLVLLGMSLAYPAYGWCDVTPLVGLQYTVALTTVASGFSYATSQEVIKLHKAKRK